VNSGDNVGDRLKKLEEKQAEVEKSKRSRWCSTSLNSGTLVEGNFDLVRSGENQVSLITVWCWYLIPQGNGEVLYRMPVLSFKVLN
jgi:hypothetical protein